MPQAAHSRLESTSTGNFFGLIDRFVLRSDRHCIKGFPPFVSGAGSLIGASSEAMDVETKQTKTTMLNNIFFSIIPSDNFMIIYKKDTDLIYRPPAKTDTRHHL
jgi:hypothetical protein